jgi:hypothetical protein
MLGEDTKDDRDSAKMRYSPEDKMETATNRNTLMVALSLITGKNSSEFVPQHFLYYKNVRQLGPCRTREPFTSGISLRFVIY